MKSSKIMKYFEEYVKKYDMNNNQVKLKYFHSLKCMDIAKDIATKLDIFTDEEITLIGMIALFHDIGSFLPESTFSILEDSKEDSTMKSINILFDEGLMRKITDDTKNDTVIKLAIFCHNKEGLPPNIDEKTVHICNILKDVHKLEELRMVIDNPYIDNRVECYPSELVYNEFKKLKLIDNKLIENNTDNILVYLSNVYELNYRYSYYLLRESDCLARITNSLLYEDRKLEKFFKQIEVVLKNYINKKIVERQWWRGVN